MKNKKVIILSFLVGILLIACAILLIHNYNNSKRQTIIETYGVVKQVNRDSVVIEINSADRTFLVENSNFKAGDLVAIKTEGNKINESKVILEGYSTITTSPIIVVEDVITTTSTTVTNPVNTTVRTTSNERTTTIANANKNTTTTTTKTTDKDQMILDYLVGEEAALKKGDNSETFKEKAKKTFCSIVDFIFYGSEIKGVTFKELRDGTKAKVVYYALLIDNGIDSKFPGYKDKLSDKYNTAKGRLVAFFLDLKYDICEKSPDGCAQASEDLKVLKKSLSLTWDTVKSFFIYVKNLTVPKIKSWYESFRG